MGSHEMHFPLDHLLPLGSLTTAPVLRVWEGLGEFGAGCAPQSTLPSVWHCRWAFISATAAMGLCYLLKRDSDTGLWGWLFS